MNNKGNILLEFVDIHCNQYTYRKNRGKEIVWANVVHKYLWVDLPVFLDLSLRMALTPAPLCLTFWGEFPDPPS